MSTRKPAAAGQEATRAAIQTHKQAQDALGDFARQQMVAGAEAVAAMSSAAGAIQQVQQQLAERTALRHQQAAQRLRSTTNPSEVLAIQLDLASSAMQEATQYWMQVAAVAARPQQQAGPATADTNPAAAANAMFTPMFQAWQNAIASSLNGGATQHH